MNFLDYQKAKEEGKSFNRFADDYANLRDANLRGADLSDADLRGADLRDADLSDADLRGANLRGANLRGADLSDANLRGANLRGANLRGADLSDADLSDADLSDANLGDANLSDANLSDATGILSASQYLEENFEFLADGSMVVYKSFGTNYAPSDKWVIEAGSILEEICNPDRGTSCGCGINVAKRDWGNFEEHKRDLWKAIIKPQWLGSVVVPFGTDGKIRCEKIQLVEIVNKDES